MYLELGGLSIMLKILARIEVHVAKLSLQQIGFRSKHGAAVYLGIRNMV